MGWLEQLWTAMVPYLAETLATLVIILVWYAIKQLRQLVAGIQSDVARRSLDSAIAEAYLAASTAVREAQQTLVDEWRKGREDGTLTPEERRLAMDAARTAFFRVISERALDVLEAARGPVDDWLDDLLEAQVQTLKIERNSVQAQVRAAASPKS